MSNYAKGRSLEYEVIDLFEKAGWSVTRGSSSKGQVLDWKPDVVATRWTNTTKRQAWMVLIQCKRGKR